MAKATPCNTKPATPKTNPAAHHGLDTTRHTVAARAGRSKGRQVRLLLEGQAERVREGRYDGQHDAGLGGARRP
jgi:hypothetical protein